MIEDFDAAGNVKSSIPIQFLAMLFPITKLEPEEIKEETDLCFSDETDLEEEFSSMQAEEVGIKSRKKKDRPKIQQVEFCLD